MKFCKVLILLVGLYMCETSSLTLPKVDRLWVFENKVLREMVGPNRDEIKGEW
jgi:hypothetical protein